MVCCDQTEKVLKNLRSGGRHIFDSFYKNKLLMLAYTLIVFSEKVDNMSRRGSHKDVCTRSK